MGRCSLTEAVPVLSACGIEAVGLPTAVLSNHTAGYKSWTYADLTDNLLDSVEHWMDYNHHFDAIYTGYLGTNQVDIIIQIIEKLKEENTMILVDPAFADGGKLYPGFGEEHIAAMRKLITYADYTVPNLTEACFIAGKEYRENLSIDEIKDVMRTLSSYGPNDVIVSGLKFEEGTVGCLMYSKQNDKFSVYETETYPGSYHGTGDLFASAFIGSILTGHDVFNSVRTAHDFVHTSIMKTLENGEPEIYYGVDFELALPSLIEDIYSK